MSRRTLTAEQFFIAIQGSGGIISTIAKRIGCAWETANSFIKSHPSVLAAYRAEQEAILDMAETVLYKSIQEGNTQDAKWLLARRRRELFGENIDVTTGGEKLQILVRYENLDGITPALPPGPTDDSQRPDPL